MSICPKNKHSKARRDSRRANWKMDALNLVKCSKCGALMMPHRVLQGPAEVTTKKKSSQWMIDGQRDIGCRTGCGGLFL